jgi:hypothetical protein
MRWDNCVLRRGDGQLRRASAYMVEVFWPKEPTKRARAKPHRGPKPQDWPAAREFLRRAIKARGEELSKREAQMTAVRDEYFATVSPKPHDRTLYREVVDPVRRGE